MMCYFLNVHFQGRRVNSPKCFPSGIIHAFLEMQINTFLTQFTTGHNGRGKAIPVQVWEGPYVCRRLRFPEFQHNQYTKVVRLSALRIGCL